MRRHIGWKFQLFWVNARCLCFFATKKAPVRRYLRWPEGRILTTVQDIPSFLKTTIWKILYVVFLVPFCPGYFWQVFYWVRWGQWVSLGQCFLSATASYLLHHPVSRLTQHRKESQHAQIWYVAYSHHWRLQLSTAGQRFAHCCFSDFHLR